MEQYTEDAKTHVEEAAPVVDAETSETVMAPEENHSSSEEIKSFELTREQMEVMFDINEVRKDLPVDLVKFVYTVEDHNGMLAVFSTATKAQEFSANISTASILPWKVDAEGIGEVYVLLEQRSNRPIYVTEDKNLASYVQYTLGIAQQVYIDNLDRAFKFEVDVVPNVSQMRLELIDIKDLLDVLDDYGHI